MVGVKKNETRKVKVKLPDNFNEKELVNKEAVFDCKIQAIKIPDEIKSMMNLQKIWEQKI